MPSLFSPAETVSSSNTIDMRGVVAATGAFCAWGLMPLYWRLLDSVSAIEILCMRIIASFLILAVILVITSRLGKALQLLLTPKFFLTLLGTGLLLGVNWFIYIWAINSGHVLETSLGYYINPLINILLGRLFLSERLTPLAALAIAIAVGGVMYQVLAFGSIPYISLGLGATFAFYGLFRKILIVEAIPGLFIETLVVLPLAVGYLIRQSMYAEVSFFTGDWGLMLLLLGTGPLSTIPLIWFAYAARRIPLTTVGLFQYLSPSLVFIQGIFIFDQEISSTVLISFVCIWIALALYSWDTFKPHKKEQNKPV